MKLTDIEINNIRTHSIERVMGRNKSPPKPWFLFIQFDINEPESNVANIRTTILKLNGEAYWYTSYHDFDVGEIMFNTLEEAQQAVKKLRRLSRGEPKFIIKKVGIFHYPKIAKASRQIQ